MKKKLLVYALAIVTTLIFILQKTTAPEFFSIIKTLAMSFLSLFPIFICIGLLDTWLREEIIIRIMGEASGIRGLLLSFFIGIFTAVPLYALLPIADLLLKKGCKPINVIIFICASTSMRIPLLLFEASSMGWNYTFIRFILNIFVLIFTALIINSALTIKIKL